MFKEQALPDDKVATKLKNFVEEESLHGGDIVNIVGLLGSIVDDIVKDENNLANVSFLNLTFYCQQCLVTYPR